MNNEKVGIMGGTFDPIHNGHLILAENARDELKLDKILFIPTGDPPHKHNKDVTPAKYRYDMTQLAIKSNSHFYISSIEIDKKEINYTIDTINHLKSKYVNKDFYFILGEDSLRGIHKWKNYEQLLRLCKFVVAKRSNSLSNDLELIIDRLNDKYNGSIHILNTPFMEISSTDIRDRVKKGLSIKYLVPESVEEYIHNKALYRQTKGTVLFVCPANKKNRPQRLHNVGGGFSMLENWYYEELKKDIGIKRFNHSFRVMDESIKLANQYNVSTEKASLAGLLHDCGKLQGQINLLKIAGDFGIILDSVTENNKELIHSPLGAVLANKKYNVEDPDILNAIHYHTTGRENMSILEKIIYIADMIEPDRDFDGVEKIRDLAYIDIDEALLYAIDNSLKFILNEGKLIHLDSVKARNQLLIQKNTE